MPKKVEWPPVKVNGYTVLMFRPKDSTSGYVLVDRGHAVHDRFVTWLAYVNRSEATDDVIISATGGHYFGRDNLGRAVKDCETR